MISFSPTTTVRSQGLITHHRRAGDLVNRSLERLSTGKRINRPSDDPAGFIAAQQLRGELFELRAESKVAGYENRHARQQNSALAQIQRTLTDARGGVVAAADGQSTPAQREAIQQGIAASVDAVNLIASRVDTLRDAVPVKAINQTGAINVTDEDNLAAAADLLDTQLTDLNRARTAAAAYERTEDYFQQLRDDQIVITTQTISQIEDADFAEESSNLATGQILQKASAAAMTFSHREQAKQLEALLKGVASEVE